MNLFIYLLICLISLAHQSHLLGRSMYSEQVLNYIMASLPKHGILRRDPQGLVYVKIDNNYIHKLIEFIKGEGFKVPPYFGEGLHGAHITVVSPEETIYHAIGEISECGQVVRFQPKNCMIVHPPTWKAGEKAFLITVDSPEMDKLREKYRLPKNTYDFHITIGIKAVEPAKTLEDL